VLNDDDNCPDTANADQDDIDRDSIGDVCDDDRDNDGLDNEEDNCPDVANESQLDTDGDGLGDACDGTDDSDPFEGQYTGSEASDCRTAPGEDSPSGWWLLMLAGVAVRRRR
jgi:MYXO-CTERM domain-containing protein